MFLGEEVVEVEPTSVEIQSDEADRAFVHPSVLADVDAAHESHVGVEEQLLVPASRAVSPKAPADFRSMSRLDTWKG